MVRLNPMSDLCFEEQITLWFQPAGPYDLESLSRQANAYIMSRHYRGIAGVRFNSSPQDIPNDLKNT